MGTTYLVYAEVNVDGKWYSLGPYYKRKDGSFHHSCIYWAQSAFFEVDNYLEDYALCHGIPADMSDDLRREFPHAEDEQMEGWFEGFTWGRHYSQTLYCVNFATAISPKVRKDRPYKYEGYVRKQEQAEFECFEREQFSEWLTAEEYESLSEKAKRQYAFYRWNDPYGEYEIFYTLYHRIWTLATLFQDANFMEIGGSLRDGITESQIRVYVYK